MKRSLIISFILYLFVILIGCGRGGLVNAPDNGVLGNLRIRTIDALSNRPVPNIKISLQKDSKPIASEQMTDNNGEVVFKNILSGDGYKAFAYPIRGYKPAASNSIKIIGNIEVTIPLYNSMGQGTGLIAGSIKDMTTGQPLGSVSILLQAGSGVQPAVQAQRIQQYNYNFKNYNESVAPMAGGTSIPTMTDQSGQFTIENIPAGIYTLSFTKMGYKKVVKANLNILEGNITNIETIFMKKEKAEGSSGNILVALGNGQVWEFDAAKNLIGKKTLGSNISCATRLANGNTVISDMRSGAVSEADVTGKTLWSTNSFLKGAFKLPSWVNVGVGNNVLVTDIDTSKVAEVSMGKVVWTLPVKLNRPACAVYTENGNILVSDTGNSRIIEVNRNGQIVWGYHNQLNKPVQVQPLPNGNVLIVDSGYCRVVEVNRQGNAVWYYDGTNGGQIGIPEEQAMGTDEEKKPQVPGLLYPRSAVRLANGNTLIADTGHNRIIEVSPQKQIVGELPNLTTPNSIEQL